jgi:hypothetical protein
MIDFKGENKDKRSSENSESILFAFLRKNLRGYLEE